MTDRVRYELSDGIATVTMDDGKVNALSLAMLADLDGALDRAEADGAAVVLSGRPGVFSAGFDLAVVRAGGAEADRMAVAAFELTVRLFSFPAPVVVACSGHALAMGMLLVLGADVRIGALGAYKIGLTEVALGIVMPDFGIELCRRRLTPGIADRALVNGEIFTPETAASGGVLDRVVGADELPAAARLAASELAALDRHVHTLTKLRVRSEDLAVLRVAVEARAAAR